MALYDDFLRNTMPIGQPNFGQNLLGSAYPGTPLGINPVTMPQRGWQTTPGVPSTNPVTMPTPMPGSAPPLAGAPVQHLGRGTPYNAPGKDMYDTRFVRERVSPMLPQGEYLRYLQARNMADPTSALGQYMMNKFPHIQQQFQVAQLSNPALSFRRFLQTGGPGKLMREFLNSSREQRGVGPQQTRTQVIGWG
jgi:hypothetical protein